MDVIASTAIAVPVQALVEHYAAFLRHPKASRALKKTCPSLGRRPAAEVQHAPDDNVIGQAIEEDLSVI